MKYKVFDDKIEIFGTTEFNPKHICECGQMFRFFVDKNGDYVVMSGENLARIAKSNTGYTIFTETPAYFVNYFDLDYDYKTAKNELLKHSVLVPAINSGGGIRIVNADKVETILEFIISANNRIPRIKAITERLCTLGEKKSGKFGKYNAFPKIEKIAEQSEDWFKQIGAGFRAKYLEKTSKILAKTDMSQIEKLNSNELYNWLVGLSGVGPKVASCIMLFAFSRRDYFPVDTWIEKVYYNHFETQKRSRKQIQQYFEDMFGEYSGLAQQYLFFKERK